MIPGRVTASREALIRVKVEGNGGRALEIEAVIDTGYDGELTLPRRPRLSLIWRGAVVGMHYSRTGVAQPLTCMRQKSEGTARDGRSQWIELTQINVPACACSPVTS
jgi:hypothetical protein